MTDQRWRLTLRGLGGTFILQLSIRTDNQGARQ